MSKITYDNKVALNENPQIADINKVTDDDMNQIKQVVNGNDDIVASILTTIGIATQTWVSGTSYTVGTIVVYANKLYECISATSGTTNPSSDTTHWSRTSILTN